MFGKELMESVWEVKRGTWLGEPAVCHIQVDQSDLLLLVQPVRGFLLVQGATVATGHRHVASHQYLT